MLSGIRPPCAPDPASEARESKDLVPEGQSSRDCGDGQVRGPGRWLRAPAAPRLCPDGRTCRAKCLTSPPPSHLHTSLRHLRPSPSCGVQSRPPKRNVQVLTSRTYDSSFIWKSGLCSLNSAAAPEQGGSQSLACFPHRKTEAKELSCKGPRGTGDQVPGQKRPPAPAPGTIRGAAQAMAMATAAGGGGGEG